MSEISSHNHHIVPLKVYLGIGAALYVLTAVTVAVSFVHLGGWNVVVALLIAAVKASLVALIYMHLLYDRKIMLVIFITAILFLAIFITFTMFDTMTRGQINESTADPIHKEAVMYDSLKASPPAEDGKEEVQKDDLDSGH